MRATLSCTAFSKNNRNLYSQFNFRHRSSFSCYRTHFIDPSERAATAKQTVMFRIFGYFMTGTLNSRIGIKPHVECNMSTQ